jgi:ABC-2 type transport system permease protein
LSVVSKSKPRYNTFWELVKIEGKLALREPVGIAFGVGAPILLLLFFGSIPIFREPVLGTSLTLFETYIPTLITTVVIMIALLGLPITLARDRELGWLRRISTTPVSPAQLLAAHVIVNLLQAVVATVIILFGAATFFGGSLPQLPIGFVLSMILLIGALFGLGLVLAAVASTEKMAIAMTQLLLYPLLFFAGVYIPTVYLPGYLTTISEFTPVGAAVTAITDAFQGTFPSAQNLLVMAAYAIIFGLSATRYFKWE